MTVFFKIVSVIFIKYYCFTDKVFMTNST